MPFKVGDIVYISYSPARAGVVVAVEQPPTKVARCRSHMPIAAAGIGAALMAPRCVLDSGHDCSHYNHETGDSWAQQEPAPQEFYTPMAMYRVRQVNGGEYMSSGVRSYEALVEDHRRKFENHTAALEKIKAFRATIGLDTSSG